MIPADGGLHAGSNVFEFARLSGSAQSPSLGRVRHFHVRLQTVKRGK